MKVEWRSDADQDLFFRLDFGCLVCVGRLADDLWDITNGVSARTGLNLTMMLTNTSQRAPRIPKVSRCCATTSASS